MNELALFAGAGGGILGGKLLGWRTVCAVEFEQYARDVLVARQNDGCIEPFPIWDDVRTFDGTPWRGIVDVVSGGFPCQDISCAGKGAGITGERSGLWKEFARIIGEVGPRYVIVENSPMLVGRGLGTVLGDLAALGYDAEWGVLGAVDAGAPHKRDRIWIMADATVQRSGSRFCQVKQEQNRNQPANSGGDVADSTGSQDNGVRGNCECGWNDMGRQEQTAQQDHDAPYHHRACGCSEIRHAQKQGLERAESAWNPCAGGCLTKYGPGRRQAGWWQSEPDVGRVANWVAARVDRLRCIGNGQVPAVVRLAWETLSK